MDRSLIVMAFFSLLKIFRLRYLLGIFVVFYLAGPDTAACYDLADVPLQSLSYGPDLNREGSEGIYPGDIDSPPDSWIRYRVADPIRLEISYAGLEKDERRPRENYRGESFFDGLNYQTEIRSWIEIGKFFKVNINPKLIGWHNNDGKNDLVFKEAYGRLTLSNIQLEVGRDSLWWGPGYHGALLISNNAFPFDMLKLGSVEPFQLPWIFGRLGYFKITSFLARLEEDRDFPRTKFFGFRAELSPFSFLDLGISRVTMFNGEGRPGLSFTDFLRMYFSNPNRAGKFDVNEIASADFKIKIPKTDFLLPLSRSIDLYGEIGGEDEAGFRPTNNGYLFGVYLPGFLKDDKIDFRVEYANNHVQGSPDVWYNHDVYTSGYVFRGDIIGHHMGSDADDLFIRVTRYLADWLQVGIQCDIERHGLSNPVIEKKKEVALDSSIYISRRIRYMIGYEYERIENLDRDGDALTHNPIPGEDATNHYVWTSISLIF
ncbi:MAG: capsule assembly Wzi family protein [Nitrospirota bacterium]